MIKLKNSKPGLKPLTSNSIMKIIPFSGMILTKLLISISEMEMSISLITIDMLRNKYILMLSLKVGDTSYLTINQKVRKSSNTLEA